LLAYKQFFMLKFIPFLVLLASCSFGPGNFQSRHSTDLETRSIRRIAVLPPEQMAVEERAKLPHSSAPSSEGKGGEKEAGTILSNLLYSTISALPHWQIVSDREVKEVLAKVPQARDSSRARKLGELVYADAVVSGRVLRFRERVGEEWGVKSPASVSFVLELWDVKRGDLIWSGRFDETQRPLNENLFAIGEFTQRGGRWLTAEELTLEGVKKAVNQLHQILYREAT